MHLKYKSVIEQLAHEAGRQKTESFIQRTLNVDKQNELDMLNYEVDTIKMLTMNKRQMVDKSLLGNGVVSIEEMDLEDINLRDTKNNTLERD